MRFPQIVKRSISSRSFLGVLCFSSEPAEPCPAPPSSLSSFSEVEVAGGSGSGSGCGLEGRLVGGVGAQVPVVALVVAMVGVMGKALAGGPGKVSVLGTG